jgi:conjugal transfer ATP-binding protein TraC
MIKNKTTEKVEVHCSFLSHPWIESHLDRAFVHPDKPNDIFSELAYQSKVYHKKAALQGYHNLRGIPAVLRDYQAYLWVSQKTKNPEEAVFAMNELREELEAELRTARLGFMRVSLTQFLKLLRRLTAPNTHTLQWPEGEHAPFETLNHQSVEQGASWSIHENYVDVSYQTDPSEEKTDTTRIVSLGVKKWPKQFALWMAPDNFCNLFRSEKGITCPFMITLQFKVMPHSQASQLASRNFLSKDQGSQGTARKMITGLMESLSEWKQLRDELHDGKVALCEVFYGVTLFSTPDEVKMDISNTINTFRSNGIELYRPRYIQFIYYLAALPFFSSEGLFQSLKKVGRVQRMKHTNVANLLPIVAEFKGSAKGVLLPTFRNQVCFMDNFDDKALPIVNFNQLIVASSGSGKSVFCNEWILNLLSRGGKVFVIDLGGSYRHLCELVDGDYIDASTLKLNPFTLFDVEDAEIEVDGKVEQISANEMVRNLLAIMSNPDENLLRVQLDWLLKAVRAVRETKGKKACIDDVVMYLKAMEETEKRDDPRLYDLILSLEKYMTQGEYGAIFNGETPLLNKKPFVVLEMDAFRERPELSKIVMFVMISIIQSEFYNSPRNQIKSCFIDEAWRWLCDGDNPIAARFIETGYRTARKHRGSFSTIVQNFEALDASKQGLAIKNCSDIKIIMRQGDFADYVEKNPKAFTPLEETLVKNFGEAKNNGFSEMMIKTGKFSSFHRLFLNPFARVLFSSDGDEFEAVKQLKAQGYSLLDAVNKVSRLRGYQ